MNYQVAKFSAAWVDCKKSNKDKIIALEKELLKLPQADIETDHVFGKHFYARTIHLPKDSVLTGMTHRTEHIFMLSKGRLRVFTEEGAKDIEAPYQVVCAAGTKRAGFALEDCICTNVHITNEKDLSKLQASLVDSSYTKIGE